MRNADDLVTQPEREEDLGRCRDERADPHVLRLPALLRNEADLAARLEPAGDELAPRGGVPMPPEVELVRQLGHMDGFGERRLRPARPPTVEEGGS